MSPVNLAELIEARRKSVKQTVIWCGLGAAAGWVICAALVWGLGFLIGMKVSGMDVAAALGIAWIVTAAGMGFLGCMMLFFLKNPGQAGVEVPEEGFGWQAQVLPGFRQAAAGWFILACMVLVPRLTAHVIRTARTPVQFSPEELAIGQKLVDKLHQLNGWTPLPAQEEKRAVLAKLVELGVLWQKPLKGQTQVRLDPSLMG